MLITILISIKLSFMPAIAIIHIVELTILTSKRSHCRLFLYDQIDQQQQKRFIFQPKVISKGIFLAFKSKYPQKKTFIFFVFLQNQLFLKQQIYNNKSQRIFSSQSDLKTTNLMSIYSGFATRLQQQTYDHCLNSLLYILQKRILKFYTNEKTDEYKFVSLVQKMYLQMRNMEKAKYLDPKCSYAIHQLFQYLIKQHDSDHNATVEENSFADDSIKEKMNRGRGNAQQKSVQYSNGATQPYHKQKTYQIPIRVQKISPNKSSKISHSNSVSKRIGRIIISSKSKQKKQKQPFIVPIQQGKNAIRQRTPSTSQESRLLQKRIESRTKKQHDDNLNPRQRNMSFNHGPGGQIRKQKVFSKSSARLEITSQLKQQQINEIIQQYIAKTRQKQLQKQLIHQGQSCGMHQQHYRSNGSSNKFIRRSYNSLMKSRQSNI